LKKNVQYNTYIISAKDEDDAFDKVADKIKNKTIKPDTVEDDSFILAISKWREK